MLCTLHYRNYSAVCYGEFIAKQEYAASRDCAEFHDSYQFTVLCQGLKANLSEVFAYQ